MISKRPLLFFISILLLASLACNAFAGGAEPALESPAASATPFADSEPAATAVANVAPTATLPAEAAPTGTAAEGTTPGLTILVDLNIRTGPGVIYDRVGFFFGGSEVSIIGRDPVSGWWKIPCPAEVVAPECWVSGGAQYTKASNAGTVPAAAVPPTPTPQPTATPTVVPVETAVGGSIISGNEQRIAFTREDGLWLITLVGGKPSAAPRQLSTAVGISAISISPDGEWIAFLRRDVDTNSLHLVNIDGGGARQLAAASDVPPGTRDSFLVLIDQFAWLPDSNGLLFNSVLVNPEGPGRSPQGDLRQVLRDGTLSTYFENGAAGHTFTLSPDGTQVLFSDPEFIKRAALGNDTLETVLSFEFVNTASDYAYSPALQWTADSSAAYVSISSPDPWNEPPFATLFRIPRDGAAETLGEIAGIILFNPILWTPDGEHLAHVNFLPGENQAELQFGDGDGDNLDSVTTEAVLTAESWDSGGDMLLFSSGDFYGVARRNADPLYFFPAGNVGGMQWLDSGTFIAAVSTPAGWNISANNLDGTQMDLFTSDAVFVQIDVWSP